MSIDACLETGRTSTRVALKVVICVREPRDVCWSLVKRDGSSVGMSWSRAQRLWIQHYKELIHGLENIPAFVVSYENWMNPDQAEAQLKALARFLDVIAKEKLSKQC